VIPVALGFKWSHHAMVHPCAKFEVIWTMFALNMVMIHHICQGFTFFDFFGQTLVNADLPISVGLGIELSHSTSN